MIPNMEHRPTLKSHKTLLVVLHPLSVKIRDQSRILADEQHGIFALGVWGMQVHMYCIEY